MPRIMKRLTHTSMSLSGGCSRRRALFAGCSAHAVHDGLTDVIYVLLPVWQSQFAMSYAWLGLLRGAYSGMMAVSQLSVGILARRRGRACLLVTDTALVGIAWLLAGMAGGLTTLLLALLLGGLGASVQHPLASSLITDSYSAGGGVKEALAQYNFAGDIGKTLLPGLVGALLAVINWRESAVLLGLSGLATAGLLWWLIPSRPAHSDMPPLTTSPVTDKASGRWLYVLTVIGTLDSAARMGFLTFLPFLLKDKGAGITDTGLGLTLLFVGGAFGKLLTGYVGTHIGMVKTVWLTEFTTAVLIVIAVYLPFLALMMMLPLLGIMLNGTSSVLYGSVPDLAGARKIEQAFAIFYTGTTGGGTLAPILFGCIGDISGIPHAIMLLAATLLLTLPLAWHIRSSKEIVSNS
ncbi:MFS transporter [Salmonella enterica]|nr:MFS transporter [Salmonella enterica]